MRIGTRLFLGFGIVIALAAVIALQGIRSVSQARDLVVGLYDGPLMAVSHARSAESRFIEARSLIETALLTQALEPAAHTIVERKMEEIITHLRIVEERMARDARGRDLATRVAKLCHEWLTSALSIIKPGGTPVTELPIPQTVLGRAEQISVVIDELVEAASAYGFDYRSSAESAVTHSRSVLIILAAVTVLIGFLFSALTARSFSRPLFTAMQLSEKIARGDFSHVPAPKNQDEFGRLIGSLAVMQDSLSQDLAFRRDVQEKKERELASEVERRTALETEVNRFKVAVEKVQGRFQTRRLCSIPRRECCPRLRARQISRSRLRRLPRIKHP